MRATGITLTLAVVALCTGAAEAGKVKSAIFGGLFSTKSQPGAAGKHHGHTHSDQAELAEFLTKLGYAKYASQEFLAKMDEALAADSIDDMVDLLDEEDFAEVGISKDDAQHISEAATKEMLRRFLASVPEAPGSPQGAFEPYLEKLLAANYDDPDDVADLEEDEGVELGLKPEQVKHLVTWADEFEGRATLKFLMSTYQSPNGGPSPFATEAQWKPVMEKIVQAGVRSLVDLGRLGANDVPGVSAEIMSKLIEDPRVVAARGKQEL